MPAEVIASRARRKYTRAGMYPRHPVEDAEEFLLKVDE
jgi:hypothetical protein